MSKNTDSISRDNLDAILNRLSKVYKKLGGRNIPVEIILIGGAAVVSNYGFRDMTTDIDAILPDVSIMKDAIIQVGDEFGLPENWMNADFTRTASYSPRLYQYSRPYRTFSQVLEVRVITGEYLIAMKLMSGRKFKNDLSDVVGILIEQLMNGNEITMSMINDAVNNLYGEWDDIPEDSRIFIEKVMENRHYEQVFDTIHASEQQSMELLTEFNEKYPEVVTMSNADEILKSQEKSSNKASVLEQLRKIRER